MKRIRMITVFFCLLFSAGVSMVYGNSTPPTIPGSFTVTVVSSTQINLSWNASTGVNNIAGYYIYRCQGTACTLPASPTLVLPNATTAGTYWADGLVAPGTTYQYTIAAYDSANNISAQAPVVSVKTAGTASTIVPVITLVQPTNGQGSVGQEFTFNMNNSTDNGTKIYGNSNYYWIWDFGDGKKMNSGSAVGHTYTNVGTYAVTLTVYNLSTGSLAISQQAIQVLNPAISGLVLRLRFNGDIFDYSGNQLATFPGGSGIPAFGPGISGHGVYLDGSAGGAYVDVKDNTLLDGLSAVTLSVHAMKNTANASGVIYGKQGQYSITLASCLPR